MTTVWIGLGGALGSIARWHLGLLIQRGRPGFPWGTLAVNLLGSLALALLYTAATRSGRIPETLRLGLGVGVLGGFTTYSTFNHETLTLAQTGHLGRASLYLAATLLGCLAAGLTGWALARAAL